MMEYWHAGDKKIAIKGKGTQYFSDSSLDGGISWIVLDAQECAGVSDADLLCLLGMEAHYGGPGAFFCAAGGVWRVRRRVLVTQRFGYDV